MAKDKPYVYVIVESYIPASTSGLHGEVHVRPVKGEKFPQTIYVSCSSGLKKNFPVGTKFRVKAKLTDREDGGEYLFSFHSWPYEVLD